MGRSHALGLGALIVALAAALDGRLTVATVVVVTLAAVAAPSAALRGRAPRVALVAGACLVAGRLALASPEPAPASTTAAAMSTGDSWTAEVRSITRRAGGRQDAVLEIDGKGQVYARLPRFPEFVPGDRIAVEGRLESLDDSPDPGSAGWVAYLERIGVSATVEAQAAHALGSSGDPTALLARLRSVAGDALQAALPEPLGGLAAGILVGLRERVDPSLVHDFTAAGLTHVIAISGWNIAIVAAVCGALARPLARRHRALVIGAVIAAYTVFAGASPSVVRAALMAGVALLSREGGRRAGASRALALAIVLMLVVDPGAAADPGFQLSACATAGLVAWASHLGGWLDGHLPRLPDALRESLAVSLTAQAATLPVVLLDFGRLSLISPLANLVAAPVVPLVMAGAAAALPLGLLASSLPGPLLSVPLALASLPLGLLVGVAHTAALVPFASVQLPPTATAPAATVAALAVVVAVRHRGSQRTTFPLRPSRAP